MKNISRHIVAITVAIAFIRCTKDITNVYPIQYVGKTDQLTVQIDTVKVSQWDTTSNPYTCRINGGNNVVSVFYGFSPNMYQPAPDSIFGYALEQPYIFLYLNERPSREIFIKINYIKQ